MILINKKLYDIDFFGSILKLNQKKLKEELVKTLLPQFYEESDIVSQDGFIYVKGSQDVMMVAHMDTVHRTKIKCLIYDKEQQILTSPEGVGGDDRCGIMGILTLLYEGYRPYILFTEDEEIGGIGASKAQKAITPPDSLKYLIEIDRRGSNDAVFYSCISQDFQKYIENFDFQIDYGSYSDIESLMSPWDICGVNLSAGYYNEHHTNEYICIDELHNVVTRIGEMLDNIPDTRFQYEAELNIATIHSTEAFDWNKYYQDIYDEVGLEYLNNQMVCDCCGELVPAMELTEKYSAFFCKTCLSFLETED